MAENRVPRMYGIDCPEGGGHVIRIAKALLPATATVEDLRKDLATRQGLAVSDLGKVLWFDECEVHNEVVQYSPDKVRFVDDSEDPPYQADFVSF